MLAIREDQRFPVPTHLTLYELLHDAEEGVLGFDCDAPLKFYLGKPFEDVCRRLGRLDH